MTVAEGKMPPHTTNAPAAHTRPGAGHGGISSMPHGTLEERLLSKIDFTQGDCWQWTATTTTWGYGQIAADRKTRPAHRVIYELLIGPVPDERVLDHLCRNRGCVNPAHLEVVTHRENILRGVGLPAQNAQKTHCKYGHPLTPDNLKPDPRFPAARGECRICRKRLYLRQARFGSRARKRQSKRSEETL